MTSEAMAAWSAQDEFAGIMQPAPGTPDTRPVMSKPPRYVASREFVREVADVLDRAASPDEVADWVIDKMERFGALMAEPMFDTEGNGPICSWCKTIWPLCGHHHQSQRIHELAATTENHPKPDTTEEK